MGANALSPIIPAKFLPILILFSLLSCQKEKSPGGDTGDSGEARAEKTDVTTFEAVEIKCQTFFVDVYPGTFGDQSVELVSTSDSTLIFLVPEVESGSHVLDFQHGKITFNVTKKAPVNAEEAINSLFTGFDNRIAAINPVTPEQHNRKEKLIDFKEEMTDLFQSFSPEEKQLIAEIYDANRAPYEMATTSIYTILNGATHFKNTPQADCPRNDFFSFYNCTADNLSSSAKQLKQCSQNFLHLCAVAGISFMLAPATLGLSTFTTALAAGAAAYMFMLEMIPAAELFWNSSLDFMDANWIFSKALFLSTVAVFKDQIHTDSKLKPEFHSISEQDADVSNQASGFLTAMAALKPYWDKLTYALGSLPSYVSGKEPCVLETDEVKVLDISNPNVALVGQSGQSLMFKTLSGNEENFDYTLRVEKEGFVHEKRLNAKVTGFDSTSIYHQACIGYWTMTWAGGADQVDKFEFYANGTGRYYWMKSSGSSDGHDIGPSEAVYQINWWVSKVGNGWQLNMAYPNRGWLNEAPLFLSPTRCGEPGPGLYFIGYKD